MTVTVHQTWALAHTEEQSAIINAKFSELHSTGRLTDATVNLDLGPSPVFSFADQAAADEWVAAMQQLNPTSTTVTPL
jgi:hypothetical protein